MIDLTSRQIRILKCIIEEYLENAEAVGSDTIDKKYNLGVSPATIRNEMSYLSEQGYLKQLHTSAGRVPTPLALKLYVKELMNKKDLSVADEVHVKEKIYESRDDVDEMLQEAARVLAERAQAIGIAYADDKHSFHAGYSHLLSMPEFFDIDVTRTVLSLIEETAQLGAIFNKARGEESIHMLFGDDLGNAYLEPVTIIFTDFVAGNKRCSLGVIGSSRMNYAYVIPMLEYFHNMITNVIP